MGLTLESFPWNSAKLEQTTAKLEVDKSCSDEPVTELSQVSVARHCAGVFKDAINNSSDYVAPIIEGWNISSPFASGLASSLVSPIKYGGSNKFLLSWIHALRKSI